MANQFETSFIPQQPLLKVDGASRPRQLINVSLVFSLIIFFVTLAVAGGAYFYEQQMFQKVKETQEALEAKEKTFDIDKITTYKNLQLTLDTAKNLADNHTIPSTLFDVIEERAAENIGLTALTFSQDNSISYLTLSGQAPSYEAVYFQVAKWRETKPLMKSIQVSSVSLDEVSGVIAFTAKIEIDSQYLGYARYLAAQKSKESATKVTPSAVPINSENTPIILTAPILGNATSSH